MDIPPQKLCVDGGVRWRQGKDGRCDRCRGAAAREAGERRRIEAERAHVDVVTLAEVRETFKPPPPATPLRTVVVRGVEYDVMWDGTA
jgi:hypothetical protein